MDAAACWPCGPDELPDLFVLLKMGMIMLRVLSELKERRMHAMLWTVPCTVQLSALNTASSKATWEDGAVRMCQVCPGSGRQGGGSGPAPRGPGLSRTLGCSYGHVLWGGLEHGLDAA